MPRRPPLRLALLLAACASAASPSAALAAPPPNDGYLASRTVNAPGSQLSQDPIVAATDTSEATVQTDLFTPPRTGGGLERGDCGGTRYGATVWYDVHPHADGAVRVVAAGYDAAVSVYEFNPASGLIGPRLDCSNEIGAVEELYVSVKRRTAYKIQIGGTDSGAGPATGSLEFMFEYFADRDRDTVLDVLDQCPDQAAAVDVSSTSDGCPEELRALSRLRVTPLSSGVRVRSLRVAVPQGARVRVRCRNGCAKLMQSRTALRAGTLGFGKLADRRLPAGARLEVFVTKAKFIGSYFSYAIRRGNFTLTVRCLRPGSTTPRRSCR